MAFDRLGAITFGFMLVPFLAYAAVVFLQQRYADATNHRQTVLSTRAAFFLPGYALFMWLSIMAPSSFTAMGVLINFVEGYSFYTFFSLIISNLGGSAQTVELMISSQKEYFLCSCCFPVNDKALFFRRTAWTMFHMFFTRVGLSIIGAICFYSGTSAGKTLFLIIQVINAAIVITMVVHLVNFYEMVYNHSSNLYGLVKLVLLKCSVGLIVLEGLICSFLISSGKTPYSDDDGDDTYDADEKTQRGYCALVLIELMILSLVYLYAFGFVKIKPSTAPGFDSSANSTAATKTTGFGAFYLSVWWLHDVFGTHWLSSDATTPLAKANAV